MKEKNKINKRAQFFALILPFIVLAMCGIVVMMYYLQSDFESSLVSPYSILSLRDKQELFEMQENQMIKESGGNEEVFCNNFVSDDYNDFRDFILKDLYYKERSDWSGVFINKYELKKFCRDIYTINSDGSYTRAELGKKFTLFAEDKSKINFAVDVEYKFSKSGNVGLKITCPALTIYKIILGSDMQANYQYYQGAWIDSDVYLNDYEKIEFEEGLGIIFDASFSSMNKISINDLEYEKAVDNSISGDDADKLFDEVKNKLKSGCR